MADVAIKMVGLDEVQRVLKDIPDHLFKLTEDEFKNSAFRVHKKVSERVRAGSPLHSRTGQLRRSLRTESGGSNLSSLHSSVYSAKDVASYAPTHEFGATIRAKNAYKNVPGGPYLNIPLGANKTPAGVMKLNARDVFARGGFIVPSKGPKARYVVMMPLSTSPLTKREFEEAAGFGVDSVPMFALVKEVTIPPRLQLYQTGEDEIPTLLSNISFGMFETLGFRK